MIQKKKKKIPVIPFQYPNIMIINFLEKNTYTREKERGSNIKAHHNFTQKLW